VEVDNGILRLELDLSSLAKKMVGAVMVHNSQLADCVKDEIDEMTRNGALESIIRQHARKGIEKAIEQTFTNFTVQTWLQRKFSAAIIGEENAGTA
jgi:hypothetical protein